MAENPTQIGDLKCGRNQPLLVIAGPCVLEDQELAVACGEAVLQEEGAEPRAVEERSGCVGVRWGAWRRAGLEIPAELELELARARGEQEGESSRWT